MDFIALVINLGLLYFFILLFRSSYSFFIFWKFPSWKNWNSGLLLFFSMPKKPFCVFLLISSFTIDGSDFSIPNFSKILNKMLIWVLNFIFDRESADYFGLLFYAEISWIFFRCIKKRDIPIFLDFLSFSFFCVFFLLLLQSWPIFRVFHQP